MKESEIYWVAYRVLMDKSATLRKKYEKTLSYTAKKELEEIATAATEMWNLYKNSEEIKKEWA